MYRYFIEMQFNGKRYCGWQVQPNSPTVQAEMNEKLSILLSQSIETVGAGRTDTGVHAKYFIAHFDSQTDLSAQLPDITHKLNNFLPQDISVQRIIPVSETSHARFDATERTYKYYISTAKDVFKDDYSWLLRYNLDIDLMNEGAEVIRQTTDFTSFSKLHSDVKTNTCHVKNAIWSKCNNQFIFTISADRFLRNMVRAIVGTLVYLGRRKLYISDIKEIIELKDRSKAGESAPAKGLFLDKIDYSYPFRDYCSNLF